MNAEELAANPRLDRWFVQNLNDVPDLSEEDARYDAVLICVGVQYLQHPLAVLREVRRVLKPEGRVIISFSNRASRPRPWRSGAFSTRRATPRLSAIIWKQQGSAMPRLPYSPTVAWAIHWSQ